MYSSGSAPAGMVPKSVPSPSAEQPPRNRERGCRCRQSRTATGSAMRRRLLQQGLDGLLQGGGQRLPFGVCLREARLLYRLGGLGDREGLPAGDLLEALVELRRGVHRVEDLAGRAPAHRRPLLEETQRIAVAVGQVPQAALLQRGRQGDDLPSGGDVHRDARGLDRLGIGHLVGRRVQAWHGDRALVAAVQDGLHLLGDGGGVHTLCTVGRARGRGGPSTDAKDRQCQQEWSGGAQTDEGSRRLLHGRRRSVRRRCGPGDGGGSGRGCVRACCIAAAPRCS